MLNFKTLANVLLPLIAVIAIGICLLFNLFQLTLGSLLVVVAVLVIGVYVGLGLARHSKRANRYYDDIDRRLRAAEGKLREHGLSLPD